MELFDQHATALLNRLHDELDGALAGDLEEFLTLTAYEVLE